MGYIHDSEFAFPLSPFQCYGTVATWAIGAGQVAGALSYKCDATDETAHLFIEARPPSHLGDAAGVAQKGFKVTDFTLHYEITAAACDDVTPVINKVKYGADGAVYVVSTPAFTYDTGHDTAAERYDVDQHKMVLSLTTPEYCEDDEFYVIDFTINKAATSIFEFYGGVMHGIFRA